MLILHAFLKALFSVQLSRQLSILFTKLHCLKNDLNKYLEDTAMYERQYENLVNLDSHIIINVVILQMNIKNNCEDQTMNTMIPHKSGRYKKAMPRFASL